ncbi:FAD-dependent oxidoreductase [Streptomyces sp. V1I1]|uniref:FAD-dependent oxidoreductase n=1 Tax=Streptomyces sp. V1I1 TaxID=3042272 RepID=UPI00358FA685
MVIVGAGMVGAACALYASRAGLRTVLVDRGPVAGGTTGAGEGNLLVSDKEPGPELQLALLSLRLWRELTAGTGGFGTAVEFHAKGGLVVAARPADLAALTAFAGGQDEIPAAGLSLMAAVNADEPPVHPEDPTITGCHHVQLLAPGSTAERSRHAMAIHPGWFDRSPCGTGTSARMAQLYARGELPLHQDFVNESFIGTAFTGRLTGVAEVGGRPAVLPTVTGRAWITGTAQYLLDPTDPFPGGFLL